MGRKSWLGITIAAEHVTVFDSAAGWKKDAAMDASAARSMSTEATPS